MAGNTQRSKAATPRARFLGTPATSASTLPSLPTAVTAWLPTLSASAPFSLSNFYQAVELQTLHPEYNSSTILRADVLVDEDLEGHSAQEQRVVEMPGYDCVRRIRRKLQPKQTRDGSMEQECLFYRSAGSEEDAEDAEGLVLLLPDFDLLQQDNGGIVPYYHPQLAALAFRYLPPPSPSPSPSTDSEPPSASIHLDILALPSSPLPTPLPIDHRIYRTALALLKNLHSVACGLDEGYQKRVHHDLLAGKEEVQDLYHMLKEKYSADLVPLHDPRITFPRWMLHEWKESTDPQKHLWEDVAVTAWLMIVWRHMYPESDGKPPGGFVDLGCGNGLLTYLLHSEGYPGYGLDLRARKSWASYNPSPTLLTTSLDPPTLLSTPAPPFPAGSFLIGNHADELTPWLPLFAAKTPNSAFLNIPCCPHTHIDRFTSKEYKIPTEFLDNLPCPPTEPSPNPSTPSSTHHHPLLLPFYAPTLNHSGRMHAYQLYLAHLTLLCGFVPEREALRMPSTKNIGQVGRKRIWDTLEGVEREAMIRRVEEEVDRMVQSAKEGWKARKPEGKAGEH